MGSSPVGCHATGSSYVSNLSLSSLNRCRTVLAATLPLPPPPLMQTCRPTAPTATAGLVVTEEPPCHSPLKKMYIFIPFSNCHLTDPVTPTTTASTSPHYHYLDTMPPHQPPTTTYTSTPPRLPTL